MIGIIVGLLFVGLIALVVVTAWVDRRDPLADSILADESLGSVFDDIAMDEFEEEKSGPDDPNLARVYRFLVSREGLPSGYSVVADGCGITYDEAGRCLLQLRRQGWITVTGQKRPGGYIYRTTDIYAGGGRG